MVMLTVSKAQKGVVMVQEHQRTPRHLWLKCTDLPNTDATAAVKVDNVMFGEVIKEGCSSVIVA